jgi:pilus assembly protein Flp/PilA
MLKKHIEAIIWKLKTRTGILLDESGQDLIEYALVVALVAFAATAGMSTLATGINTAFSNIASVLNATIT